MFHHRFIFSCLASSFLAIDVMFKLVLFLFLAADVNFHHRFFLLYQLVPLATDIKFCYTFF